MTSSIVLIYSDYSVTFVFSTGKENTTWFVSQIGVDIGTSKNGERTIAEKNFTEGGNSVFLNARKNHSYLCDIKDEIKLSKLVNVTIDNIMVQPFINNNKFSKQTDSCTSKSKPAKSSSIVPIAVGCALAGLIIIVLIAYLIGRRKNDGRGYQQV